MRSRTTVHRRSAAHRRARERTRTRREPAAPRRDASAPFALDGTLITAAALLAGLGVVMNYSTTAALEMGAPLPSLALRHWVGMGCAIATAFVAARLPLVVWARLALPLYAVSIALLAATPLFGASANGATRWLALPGLPVSIQASEPARLFTALALAMVLARHTERGRPHPRALRTAVPLVLLPAGLLLFQPDFGSAVVLVAVAGLVVFASGLPLRILAVPAAGFALVSALYIAARPYALARLHGFLDPWENRQGDGFQLVQSFVAFGRGGPFGVGLGDGRQKLMFLPEAHTDFILSVVAEELGLVGVLFVLGAFAAIAIAGLRIARRARDPLPLLVATGMTAMIALPAAINAAVVMGLAPTTGLTLPFLSHGSNSLVCSAVALGILLRIAGREAAWEAPRVRDASPRGWVRA